MGEDCLVRENKGGWRMVESAGGGEGKGSGGRRERTGR